MANEIPPLIALSVPALFVLLGCLLLFSPTNYFKLGARVGQFMGVPKVRLEVPESVLTRLRVVGAFIMGFGLFIGYKILEKRVNKAHSGAAQGLLANSALRGPLSAMMALILLVLGLVFVLRPMALRAVFASGVRVESQEAKYASWEAALGRVFGCVCLLAALVIFFWLWN